MKKLISIFILCMILSISIVVAEHETNVPDGMTWEEYQDMIEDQYATKGFLSIFDFFLSTSYWETCQRDCVLLSILGDCSVCPSGYTEVNCAWHPDSMSVLDPWTSASAYCNDWLKPYPDYNKQCYCVEEEEEEIPDETSDAGNCNPDSGYDYCEYSTYTYGPATARVEIQLSKIQGTYRNGYYVGPTFRRYKMEGDKFYQGINKEWSAYSCNENGCSGLPSIASSGNYQLTSNPGDHWTDCIYFVAWDRRDVSGYWSWTAQGYGWTGSGNCFDIKQVECYDNSDCGLNNYCDKSGDWTTWNCQDYECLTGQEKCVGTDFYLCENNNWVNKEETAKKCGIECLIDSDCNQGYFCDNFDFDIMIGTPIAGNCELRICNDGEERCFGTNLQKCENNQWVDKGAILNKCNVECLDDSNCLEDQVSDKFCSGNNIMETRTDNYCFTDYQCDSSTQDVILEACSFKCEEIEGGAICIDKICDEGELMCSDEGNALMCQNNQWELKEECEYGCEEGWCKSFYTTNTFYGIIAGSIAVLIIIIILIIVFTSKKRKR